MSRLRRRFPNDHDVFVIVACLVVILATPQRAFAWAHEGHQIIAILAEHYMRPETAAGMRALITPRPNGRRGDPFTGPRIPSPQPLTPSPRWTARGRQPILNQRPRSLHGLPPEPLDGFGR